MRKVLPLLGLLLMPAKALCGLINPVNSSSMTFLAHMNENGGTVIKDSSKNHANCTLLNSPVFVTGAYGSAIKFDNTNSYMTCNVTDIAFGGRPRTVMFMYKSDAPASKALGGDKWLFKIGEDSAGGFFTSSQRNDCGGCLTIWPSDGTQKPLTTLKLSTSTWNVVTFTTMGTGTPVTGYIVSRDGVKAQSTSNITMNTLPGTIQWGAWSVASQDMVATMDEPGLWSRYMPRSEVVGLSIELLGATVQQE